MTFDVIILAAGTGSRLGDAAGGLPKALFPIHGRSLLGRAIDFARTLSPRAITVVGGFRIERVADHLRDIGASDVTLVDNPRFRDGNLESVRCALARVDGGFVLTNADHVFPAGTGARMAAASRDEICAWCEFVRTPEPDEMRVVLDPRGRLARISKSLTAFDGAYVGVTRVPAGRRGDYERALARVRERRGAAAVAEEVLQALADGGVRVDAPSMDGIRWFEVDTPADLARAASGLAPEAAAT